MKKKQNPKCSTEDPTLNNFLRPSWKTYWKPIEEDGIPGKKKTKKKVSPRLQDIF